MVWLLVLALCVGVTSQSYSEKYCNRTTATKQIYWQAIAPDPFDCIAVALTRNYNNNTRVYTFTGPSSNAACVSNPSFAIGAGATYSLTLSADGRQLLGTYRLSSICSGDNIPLNLTRAHGAVPCFTGYWVCDDLVNILHVNALGIPGVTWSPTSAPTTAQPTSSPSTLSPSASPTTISPSTSPTTQVPTTLSPSSSPITRAPSTQAPSKAPTSSPTSFNACSLVQSNLTQGACSTVVNNTAPTPGQPPGYVVSVAVDLHTNGTNGTNFTFQLPIDANLKRAALQRIADQGCLTPDLRCEWMNPATNNWEHSGCQLVAQTDSAAYCDCSHLTVFSLVLRSKSDRTVLCQARTLDYVMLGLFALMGLIAIVQCTRLLLSHQLKNKAFATLLTQHVVLVLVCILRIVFLSAKPVLEPAASVFIALLPTLLELGLLLYIGSLWTAINLNPMNNNNNNNMLKLKIPFAIAFTLCVCLTLTTPIFMSAAGDESTQARLAEAGSYQMSVVTALTAILIIASGLSLVKVLGNTKSHSSTGSAAMQRISVRLTLVAVGAGSCLLVLAILWSVAVSGGVMGSTQASDGVDGVFYCTEILLLGLLLYLFQAAVAKLTNTKPPAYESSSMTGAENSTSGSGSKNKWVPLKTQKSGLTPSESGMGNLDIAALLEENRKIPALQQELEQLKKELGR